MLARRSVMLFLLAVACSTGSGGGSEESASAPRPAHRGGMSPITEADLQEPGISNGSLFEAVRLLRPGFLAGRGAANLDNPQSTVLVSIDGSGLSPVSTLNSIQASQVGEVRYLSAIDAAQRFGTTTTGGPVLLVTMRRR